MTGDQMMYIYPDLTTVLWGSFTREIYPAFSLVETFSVLKYFHARKGHIIGALSVATPAVLCHKEPARRIQSPLLGALERKLSLSLSLLLAGSLWHENT